MTTNKPDEVRRDTMAGRRATARTLVLAGVLIAAVALAACGGGSSSSSAGSASTTPSSTGGAAGSGSLAAFRACMSGQGIALPQRSGTSTGTPPSTSPGGTRPAGGAGGTSRFNTPPPGVNAATYQAALNACRSTLPTGGTGASGASGSAFQAYRSCLGDHGVTLPSSGGLSGLSKTDPKVVAAMTACKALAPTGGPGGGSSTTIAGA